MATPDRGLIDAVRTALAAAGDPRRGLAMQAYLKSTLPCYGVPLTPLRTACKKLFALHPLADRTTWLATVLALWREATHREERYVAIVLTGDRRYRAYQATDLIADLYEELVVTGAWWDLVDDVAIRRIGPILRADPAGVTPLMTVWATDMDLWKRRTSIICQVGGKKQTDRRLLAYTIDRNVADKDFFIRKAIGWALREYAKEDPEWVRTFVGDRESTLSGLSKREALKHVPHGLNG